MSTPLVVATPGDLRERCAGLRRAGQRLGFVPTMGALHAGHLALVDEARRRCDQVVVSIFVNPTQFGPHEDFARYPRTLDAELAALATRDVGLVFAPAADEMYPAGHATTVHVARLGETLCGRSRPGHFDGVATVVAKLFNLVGPCVAVFGRKDYQQLAIVRRLAADLALPVEVVGLATVREPDGLALSSRNRYLTPAERVRALALARGLTAAHARFAAGERRIGALRVPLEESLRAACDSVDYVTAADPDTLADRCDDDPAAGRLLLAVAARLGTTRLIDNTVLGEDRPPCEGHAP